MAQPSPAKRSRTAAPSKPPSSAAVDPSLANSLPSTSSRPDAPSSAPRSLTRREREQLLVVVESIAPPLVLEQTLSVPSLQGKTLRDALAVPGEGEEGVEIAVLRSAINESSTSALLSSTMMMSFDMSGDDGSASAKMLNEIDEFQRTVLGVLEQLEERTRGGKGVKREAEEDSSTAQPQQPPSKLPRKYMLHRSLTTGGTDLFTSAAMLSEADLADLSSIDDTDLIAVLPTLPSSLPPLPSHPTVPPPSLGSSSPRPPFSSFPSPSSSHIPALQRLNLAPEQRFAPLRDAEEDETEEGKEKGVDLLYYGVYGSSLAPAWDSTGAGGKGYVKSAGEALRKARVGRWEAALSSAPALLPSPASATVAEEREVSLTVEEQDTLKELGVSVEEFKNGLREREKELEVWRRLEANSRVLERVGRRQVARVLRVGREGREKERGKAGKGAVKEEGEGEGEENVGGLKVEGKEREEADALLLSLSRFIASRSTPNPSSTSSTSSSQSSISSRLIPPPSLLAHLTPLYLASTAKEPSYYGTLEEGNEKAVREGGFAQAPATGAAPAEDLQV
ncbi:hypothetical protein JCM8547_004120 [Rhodosporidiobolus lusitaniae]